MSATAQYSTPLPTAIREKESNKVLYSWKEIAAFLKCSIRTAQRWEREEGLPVHRHDHNVRGTAYAQSEEIDEWLKTRESAKAFVAPSIRLARPAFVDRRQAVSDTHHRFHFNQIMFLKVQLGIALTFASIALDAGVGSPKRIRNIAHATRIYRRVLPFVERATYRAEEAQEITATLSQLLSALWQLGESTTAAEVGSQPFVQQLMLPIFNLPV